jgi:hypothetical protein
MFYAILIVACNGGSKAFICKFIDKWGVDAMPALSVPSIFYIFDAQKHTRDSVSLAKI